MRKSSLSINTVSLYNPLPENISEADLHKMAGVYSNKAREDVPAFRVQYIWGGTGVDQFGNEEYEEFVLDPGDSREGVPENSARVLMKTLQTLGIVAVTSETNVLKEAHAGLQKALAWYEERGPKYISKYQQRHSLTDEQMRLERNTLTPYLLNAERVKLIRHEIEKLEKELANLKE